MGTVADVASGYVRSGTGDRFSSRTCPPTAHRDHRDKTPSRLVSGLRRASRPGAAPSRIAPVAPAAPSPPSPLRGQRRIHTGFPILRPAASSIGGSAGTSWWGSWRDSAAPQASEPTHHDAAATPAPRRPRLGIFCCGTAALRQRLPPPIANAQPLPAAPRI